MSDGTSAINTIYQAVSNSSGLNWSISPYTYSSGGSSSVGTTGFMYSEPVSQKLVYKKVLNTIRVLRENIIIQCVLDESYLDSGAWLNQMKIYDEFSLRTGVPQYSFSVKTFEQELLACVLENKDTDPIQIYLDDDSKKYFINDMNIVHDKNTTYLNLSIHLS